MPGAVENALVDIAAAYAKVSVESGYSQDVRFVTRHVRNPRDFTNEQLVAVMVARNPNAHSAITYIGNETYKQVLRVEVMAFMRGDGRNPDQFGLATAAEALLSDLKRVQLNDSHFGGSEVRESWIVDDFNDAGWEEDGAMVSVGIEAVVVWNAPAPP